jgi:hypothetical protein
MIHPDTELRWAGDQIGWGVFAKAMIPAGTIVYVRDSLEVEVRQQRVAHLHPLQEAFVTRYGYRDELGNWVVSIDNARFVNHCCDSNSLSTGYGFEIAVRDIQPGEELTDDYGLLNLDYSMDCQCGSENCRGSVRTDDLHAYHEYWDSLCRAALLAGSDVPQPLLELVAPDMRVLVSRFQSGDEKSYCSVLCLDGGTTANIPAVLLA